MTNARDYWDAFYAALASQLRRPLGRPSPFAYWAIGQLAREPRGRVVDAGCGNGRDSLLWALAGWPVVAIDNCPAAVRLTQQAAEASGASVEARLADLTEAADLYAEAHLVYGRWCLQAIDDEAQGRWLEALAAMPAAGRLAIEARALPAGRANGRHVLERVGHYRRLLDPALLLEQLRDAGWRLQAGQLGRGLSPIGRDDPLLVRAIFVRGGADRDAGAVVEWPIGGRA